MGRVVTPPIPPIRDKIASYDHMIISVFTHFLPDPTWWLPRLETGACKFYGEETDSEVRK